MSFITPAIPYITIRDAILTTLRNNVATLNTNLTTTITSATTQIIKGNPAIIPYPLTLYPYIFVDIVSKSEDYSNIGAAGRRMPEIIFSIYGFCRNCIDAMSGQDEVIKLTENIESVLRDNGTLGLSVDLIIKSMPGETTFNDFQSDQTYIHAVGIKFTCKIIVS